MIYKPIAILAFVTLLAGPFAQGQYAPRDEVQYQLAMACPPPNTRCPVLAIDQGDAMGNPTLAVDPDRPERLVISSLHGEPNQPGAPSAVSRAGSETDGGPFTTFTSHNSGAAWNDNPYLEPSELAGAFGQHTAITFDPFGHVLIGSLYARPADGGGFEYTMAAQKFNGLDDINQNQDGSYSVQLLSSVYPKNVIANFWFVYDPASDLTTVVWTEHVAPASPGLSPLPIPPRPPVESIASAQPVEGPRSVIGVVWTRGDPDAPYLAPGPTELIGPCATSTNPVVSEGWVYIGCQVASHEAPLAWDPNVASATLVMFRFKPNFSQLEYIGPSPLTGGTPKLGVRSDGRIALLTADATDGQPRLDGTFGKYDPATGLVKWSEVYRYGDSLEEMPGDMPLVNLNVQDMIYREYSGVLHLVLKRVGDQQRALTQTAALGAPLIHKSILAISEEYGPLMELPLDVGNVVNRSQDPEVGRHPDAAFNDLSDDFLELPAAPFAYKGRSLGTSYQREFFAVGAYGVVQFAEIIELTNLRGPQYAVPPPPPPVATPPPASPMPAFAAVGAFATSAIMSGLYATKKRKTVTRAKK